MVPVALFGVVLLAAAGQGLPDGPGKALVAERCADCHGLDRVTESRLDREGWTAVVAKMIQNGARLDEPERQTVVTYLSSHFGVPPPVEDPAVEEVAQRYITGICSSCHDAGLITGTRASSDGWLEIVENMNGKGAGLSDADVTLLAGYLARRYPQD